MSLPGKLLIANRGEIACRIARTARKLGIVTIAVYSDADAGAAHVAACDEAVRLGPAPAAESYLCADKIISAAQQTGAEAVHPGYGFLAENADFADALARAGLLFIGPPASAIRAMGGKSAAKALMAEAGVPLVPGYHGDDQSPERLGEEALKIGFPLLAKASAGGGGKGMKVVEHAGELVDALASARREALAAFGDEKLLLERYLQRPRHVEIQVFADRHGHCLHLFERDCSIQRRHQKVVEEAPAPHFSSDLRQQMGAAACKAALAIDYVGAGTVEFLLDQDGRFYFMEMNTRLQVEHPVTEAITGLDLVEWQLRVAAGAPLPWQQDQLDPQGHAIEVRLYAEDPARGFLPQTGRISRFDTPVAEDFRVDAGIRGGDTVTPHYDPMIAKLIARGPDRAAACRRLGDLLAGTRLRGLSGNLAFLRRLIDHPDFVAGDVDTGFIARHESALLHDPEPDAGTLTAAALYILARQGIGGPTGPDDPWQADGWWPNLRRCERLIFQSASQSAGQSVSETNHEISVQYPDATGIWRCRSGERDVLASDLDFRPDHGLTLRLDGRLHVYDIDAVPVPHGQRLDLRTVIDGAGWVSLDWLDPLAPPGTDHGGNDSLMAPMPGKVIALLVEAGQTVEAGAPLLVLEAMKMEHTIKAPAAGTIRALPHGIGDQVTEGTALIDFVPDAE